MQPAIPVCASATSFVRTEAIQQGAQASVQEQNFLATCLREGSTLAIGDRRTISCQAVEPLSPYPPLEITGDCPFFG